MKDGCMLDQKGFNIQQAQLQRPEKVLKRNQSLKDRELKANTVATEKTKIVKVDRNKRKAGTIIANGKEEKGRDTEQEPEPKKARTNNITLSVNTMRRYLTTTAPAASLINKGIVPKGDGYIWWGTGAESWTDACLPVSTIFIGVTS
jgi:hypothetical protein